MKGRKMVKSAIRRTYNLPPSAGVAPPPMDLVATSKSTAARKKAGGSQLWMRMDRFGQSQMIECDKSVIVKRVSIPARDLRILGPIFSHSSSILAREKAMIINLEYIRAIVTAEEVLLLDPLCQEVLPFVDQLRRQLSQNNSPKPVSNQTVLPDNKISQSPGNVHNEGVQDELPFEFQVLEIVLGAVCTFLDSNVIELERDAYPTLDELAVNVSTKNLEHVSTKNLEHVRSLKSNLTRLLARVQKVRDENEHLLDDNKDMVQLYLTRKWIIQNQQNEVLSASNSIVHVMPRLHRSCSTRSGSLVSKYYDEDDVDDLEMLLEAYFMQLDGTRNKILSVREYIDDTEDYVEIQLDTQRNELIQF